MIVPIMTYGGGEVLRAFFNAIVLALGDHSFATLMRLSFLKQPKLAELSLPIRFRLLFLRFFFFPWLYYMCLIMSLIPFSFRYP